jgi:hypothetical protein
MISGGAVNDRAHHRVSPSDGSGAVNVVSVLVQMLGEGKRFLPCVRLSVAYSERLSIKGASGRSGTPCTYSLTRAAVLRGIMSAR